MPNASKDKEQLYQITNNYLCAGVVVVNNKAAEAAPILRWMVGKHINYIKRYCEEKEWKIGLVS